MAAVKKKFRTVHRLILPAALGDWIQYRPQPRPTELPWPSLEKKVPAEKILAWRDHHYRWGQNLVSFLKETLQLEAELHEVMIAPADQAGGKFSPTEGCISAQIDLPGSNETAELIITAGLAKYLSAENLGQGFAELTGAQPLTELDLVNLQVTLEKIFRLLPPVKGLDLPAAAKIGLPAKENSPAAEPRSLAAGVKLELAGKLSGWLEIRYPESVLTKILPLLPETTPPARRRINLSAKSLENLAVTCRVILGSSTVTTGELSRLQPGDVVLLEKSMNEPLEIVFGDDVILSGGPGLANRRLAIQILPMAAAFSPKEKKEVDLMKGKEYFSGEKEGYLDEDLEEEALEKEKEDEVPEEEEKEIPEEETEKEEVEKVEEDEDEYEEYEEDEEDAI